MKTENKKQFLLIITDISEQVRQSARNIDELEKAAEQDEQKRKDAHAALEEVEVYFMSYIRCRCVFLKSSLDPQHAKILNLNWA